jgi:hypothetical protein
MQTASTDEHPHLRFESLCANVCQLIGDHSKLGAGKPVIVYLEVNYP